MQNVLTAAVLGSALLVPSIAVATSYGHMGVQCWGNCNTATLGGVCDAYIAGSIPIMVHCNQSPQDDSAIPLDCGGVTCARHEYNRSDYLGQYCDDGPDYDAIVTCMDP